MAQYLQLCDWLDKTSSYHEHHTRMARSTQVCNCTSRLVAQPSSQLSELELELAFPVLKLKGH